MINHTSEMHLLTGRCLLSGCEVCTGGPGMSHQRGLQAYTLTENAEEIWRENRNRLLSLWRDPNGPTLGASGFSPESIRGAGCMGIPCWAEIEFEGATLPKYDKTWPDDIKKIWRELKD